MYYYQFKSLRAATIFPPPSMRRAAMWGRLVNLRRIDNPPPVGSTHNSGSGSVSETPAARPSGQRHFPGTCCEPRLAGGIRQRPLRAARALAWTNVRVADPGRASRSESRIDLYILYATLAAVIVSGFDWDDDNIIHIGRHQFSPEEVEEVFAGGHKVRRTRHKLYIALGETLDGRLALVVFRRLPGGLIRVVTARDMDDSERRLFRRK